MAIALKVIGVIFLLLVAFIIGVAVGESEMEVEWKDKDGWLVRPYKHLRCGAVYGHLYIKDTPEAGGWYGVRCKRCGKTKVRKVMFKCG